MMTNAPQPIDWPVRVRDKNLDPSARRSQWPLDHPSLSSSGPAECLALSSSIKVSYADKAGRCYQFVCPAWPIRTYNTTPTPLFSSLFLSLETLAHHNRHRAHCTKPLKVSGPQTSSEMSNGIYWPILNMHWRQHWGWETTQWLIS